MFTTPDLLCFPSPFNFKTMASWRTDPTQLPQWVERPKCRYRFRTILRVCMDQDRHYGHRYFTYPDLDDDFMVRT